jgi:GNAT superfamily N-acetyltransferase
VATFTDMTVDDFRRLPRHPDWKYELIDGRLLLSHRPRPIDLLRSTDVAVERTGDRHTVQPLDPTAHRTAVTDFLISTWREESPYCHADPAGVEAQVVAEVDRSWTSLADPAGVVSVADGSMIGAALLTDVRWPEAEDGVPVLSWLTVAWGQRLAGVATAMLDTLLTDLRGRGITHLRSATSCATPASIQWHWRHGFLPLSDPLARVRGDSGAAR